MNDFLEVYDYYEPEAQQDCENIIKCFAEIKKNKLIRLSY